MARASAGRRRWRVDMTALMGHEAGGSESLPPASPDILAAGGRVDVELAAALAEEELDGGKVTLVNRQVLCELGSGAAQSA